GPDRLAYAVSLHIRGDDVRWPELDNLQRVGAVHPHHRARLFRDQVGHAVLHHAAGVGSRRPRRRQFRFEHDQHLILLSRSDEGLGARFERSRRQCRRQQRSTPHAAPDGARHHQSLPGHPRSRRHLHSKCRVDVAVALAIAVFGATFFMNNLTTARSSFKDQLAIIGREHTWIMSFIYIGTFGSFIGYSAAFPLLIKTQFPAITVGIAFLGPLVGSLSRPLGGLLADKVGGAIVTF